MWLRALEEENWDVHVGEVGVCGWRRELDFEPCVHCSAGPRIWICHRNEAEEEPERRLLLLPYIKYPHP